jgi:predicted nucleic acid-binding Zn ribbon protein
MPSRKKPDPGWLQVQRERYGPDYRVPPKHSIQTAGDLVGGVLKKFGLETSAQLGEFQKAWPELAGKDNAAHSRPGSLERGILTIYVDHHVWLNEMKRVASASLKKRLQARFGTRKVKDLRFVMTPPQEEI